MDVQAAMLQRRSIRKFLPEEISPDTLKRIVETARLYPSGGNLQPIRFAIITDSKTRDALFGDLRWAMYLPDFTILPQEHPTAYIILLRDDRVKQRCDYDVGAASTMVMLSAVSFGLASCPIGSFRPDRVSELLRLKNCFKPELIIALGYPAQESRIVPMQDSVKYAEDAGKNLLVPKWRTEDVLIYCD